MDRRVQEVQEVQPVHMNPSPQEGLEVQMTPSPQEAQEVLVAQEDQRVQPDQQTLPTSGQTQPA